MQKILVNLIQEYIIKIIHHDKFCLFWGCKTDWNLRINLCNSLNQQTKEEKKHIYINTCRKDIWKNSLPSHGLKEKLSTN